MMSHHSKNRMMTYHHVVRLPDMFGHVCMKTMENPENHGFCMVFVSHHHVTMNHTESATQQLERQ